MASHFEIPPRGLTYIDDVVDRCKNLINFGIWSGIDWAVLNTWLNNFQTDSERFFSACILDSLIYRSNEHTQAMMYYLFESVLPNFFLNDINNSDFGFSLLNSLSTDGNLKNRIRLIPILIENNPTKSGNSISYIYKKVIGIKANYFVEPNFIWKEMANGVEIFIFIDDFLGTGTQFYEFIQPYTHLLNQAVFVYAPLVAHEFGVENLKRHFPTIKVIASEILNSSHDIFSDESNVFSHGNNNAMKAREFYYKLLKSRNIDVNEIPRRGFGSLSLAFSFQHSPPDNSIPLLWYASSNWQPLFRR